MRSKKILGVVMGVFFFFLILFVFSGQTPRFVSETSAAGPPIFDRATHPPDGGGGESLSWQHLVTNSPNRLLLVGINADNAYFFGSTVTVRANGRQLTRRASQYCSPNSTCAAEFYYLKNPDPGTNTIQVTADTFFPELTAGAASFYNVDQNQTFGSTGRSFDSGIASSTNVTVSTTNADQLVVETMACSSICRSVSPKSGQTFLWANHDPTTEVGNHSFASYKIGGSSQTTMGWNMDYNGFWAEVAVAINPAPPTPTSAPTPTPISGGDVRDLNFVLSDSMPWIQTYGLDVRFDEGFSNPIPLSANVACGGGAFASANNPGIVFSGDGGANFGLGRASVNDWIVGGFLYPEVFISSSQLKTSTSSLLVSANRGAIPVIEMGPSTTPTCPSPGVSSCDLSGLSKGLYYTSGDLRIERSYSFTAGNYVFVADGTIYIENGATVTVAPGATVIFSAGEDINIDPSIHASTNICPAPAGQLQGVFSADRNIILRGNNNCVTGTPDTMLNIDGTLIVNAAKVNGTFQNQRDLCGGNTQYPAITIRARPDFILNTPGFLTQQQTVSHEESP